jgi:starch synthase
MKIAFLTPELFPFAKTGGLADVSSALTQALAKLGHAITVYMPAYTSAQLAANDQGLSLITYSLAGAGPVDADLYDYCETAWRGMRLVLVQHQGYYERDHPYLDLNKQDYPDNLARYAFFCSAALTHVGQAPCDLVHLNDWQSSLAAAYITFDSVRLNQAKPKTILTVHNLGYQGQFHFDLFPQSGLPWQHFNPEEFEYYGHINLLKGGLVHADALTTVSPSYAEEVQTADFGHGLDGVLRDVAQKLTGILNGIDAQEWNPETDPHLPARYAAHDMSGKAKCKRELQRQLELPVRPKCLLLGCITRLDRQKGIELILAALPQLLPFDIQLVLLGSGDIDLEERLTTLAQEYPLQIGLQIGYDEALAHLIEAGSDLFLMPSLYEPCGLNQMYSQRYGTLPVVRETGGLQDTVQDIALDGSSGNGFIFRQPTADALVEAIRRAALLYFTGRRSFNTLARSAMQVDHSWDVRAQAYVALYESLLATSGTDNRAAQQSVSPGAT